MSYLAGKDAKFSWTPGTGDTLVAADCLAFSTDIGTQLVNITPIGELWDQWAALGKGGRGTLEFRVTTGDATGPVIPSGTEGALIIYKDKNQLTQGALSGNAILERLNWSASRGGTQGIQASRYSYRWTGTVTEL